MASSLLHILKGVCNKNIVGISKPGKARLNIEVSQKMFLPTVGIRPGLNLFCFLQVASMAIILVKLPSFAELTLLCSTMWCKHAQGTIKQELVLLG